MRTARQITLSGGILAVGLVGRSVGGSLLVPATSEVLCERLVGRSVEDSLLVATNEALVLVLPFPFPSSSSSLVCFAVWY
jgi:hypothetical protein